MEKKDEKQKQFLFFNYESNGGRYIYLIFHLIMMFVAVYLTWRCNDKFSIVRLLGAIFFPYVYIIYVLSTQGTCGIIETKSIN